ncbi:hypothetical protein BKA66DRAFT_150740 [Pyrenochaeta sp. MPI-SDFR-AT-0127]|nr:hypothetical protein BKA66DRAFT_150740 [Pyrenochaeta sp. MPI-SDFR-AT-0127]
MTPNLFLATQKVFSPHKWFKASKSERPTRRTEEWTSPVPGQYEYIPGRGWYLIATLKDAATDASRLNATEGGPVLPAKSPQSKEYVVLEQHIKVHYSRFLRRNILDHEYKLRKKQGMIKNENGKLVERSFFKLDDGITWVQCYDAEGNFVAGGEKGYQRWVIDSQTQQFRHMLKRDNPDYIRSRNNSPERDGDSHSQDSMSSVFRTGPGSTRDGLSVPSTRANSIRFPTSNPTSRPPSQRPSRQNSPRRNNSIPLEEAKAALRRMAREQEEADVARSRRNSRERGRPTARVGN